MMAAGGALGLAAGVGQITAGLLQGFGGANFQNAQSGAAALALGFGVGRAFGPMIRSGNSIVAGSTAAAGGTFDLVVDYIETLAPQSNMSCGR